MMIKDQIDMILQKRKLKAQQLREKKENLENICGCLDDCRMLYTEAKSITDKEFRKQYMNLFAALPSESSPESNVSTVTISASPLWERRGREKAVSFRRWVI